MNSKRVTLSFEVDNPTFPKNLTEVQAYFAQPELRAASRDAVAGSVHRRLDRMGFGEEYRLTDGSSVDQLDMYIDPSLPTVAIDTIYGFSGSELMGVVAGGETKKLNILFTTFSTPDVVLAAGEHGTQWVEVNGATLLADDGTIRHGPLQKPVRADLVVTADMGLLQQLEGVEVSSLHNLEQEEIIGDKRNLDQLLPHVSLAPHRLDRTALSDRSDVVIKPASEAQGLGVLIGDDETDASELQAHFDFLEQNGYDPIIEERIKSWPLQDPETGERLDWNVRALVGGNRLLDMYIRAQAWGSPVNKSLGARAITMSQLHEFAGDESYARELRGILDAAADSVARTLPIQFGGIDLTINESGEPKIFEVNGGYSGGVQTIGFYEEERARKLQSAGILYDQWTEQLQVSAPSEQALSLARFTPSLAAMMHAGNRVNADKLFREYQPNTAHTSEYVTRNALTYLGYEQITANILSYDMEKVETLFRDNPLEADSYLSTIAMYCLSDRECAHLVRTTDRYLAPDQSRALLMDGFAAGVLCDLDAIRSIASMQPEDDVDNRNMLRFYVGSRMEVNIRGFMQGVPQSAWQSDFPQMAAYVITDFLINGGEPDILIEAMKKSGDPLDQRIGKALELRYLANTIRHDELLARTNEYYADEDISEVVFEVALNDNRDLLRGSLEGAVVYARIKASVGLLAAALDELISWSAKVEAKPNLDMVRSVVDEMQWDDDDEARELLVRQVYDLIDPPEGSLLYESDETILDQNPATQIGWLLRQKDLEQKDERINQVVYALMQRDELMSDSLYLTDLSRPI